MPEFSNSVGERFQAERLRLKLGVQEAAEACGVTRNAISKIERAGAMPSGPVLQAFASKGADVSYVLTGERAGLIDLTLMGVAEAALANAYVGIRGVRARPERVRARMVALVYNQIAQMIRPEDDVGVVARAAAAQLLASLDDPSDPDLLDRNLLRSESVSTARGGVTVSGDNNRVAGGDYTEGGAK